MHHMRKTIWFAILGPMLASCMANLSVAAGALRDRSAPTVTKAQVSAVIVLPPRGSERGQVSELADLERVLLGRGFRVISSGITGRVASGPVEARADEASRLSDLERALILAKDSNADALLQVGEIGFVPAERYFTLLEGDLRHFKEVPEPPARPGTYCIRIKEARFTFQAKLINVENGEIVVSMDISQSTSRVSPMTSMDVLPNREETTMTIDSPQRRQAAVMQVMDAFNNHISARSPQARAKE
jgi:hypothetical protein